MLFGNKVFSPFLEVICQYAELCTVSIFSLLDFCCPFHLGKKES